MSEVDVQELEKACKRGDLDTIREIYASGKLAGARNVLDVCPVFLLLALSEACHYGHVNIITYLVTEAKCNINKEAPGMGHLPLGLAALYISFVVFKKHSSYAIVSYFILFAGVGMNLRLKNC